MKQIQRHYWMSASENILLIVYKKNISEKCVQGLKRIVSGKGVWDIKRLSPKCQRLLEREYSSGVETSQLALLVCSLSRETNQGGKWQLKPASTCGQIHPALIEPCGGDCRRGECIQATGMIQTWSRDVPYDKPVA